MRNIAAAWWYWDLRYGLEATSDAAMEARIKGLRADAFGTSYRNNQLRKIRRGITAPGLRTLRQADHEVPGSSEQFVSPLWMMLSSRDPFDFWISEAADFFRGEVSDWIRRSSAEEYARDFLLHDALEQLCSADRLCIQLGVFMTHERAGRVSEARHILKSVVKDLLKEHLQNPLGPHVQLFWKASSRIFQSEDSVSYLAGYDLGAACQIARLLQALKLSELGPIHYCQFDLTESDILLPGNVWGVFAGTAVPATIGMEIDGKAVRLHALHGDPAQPHPDTGGWQVDRIVDLLRPLYRPWEQPVLDSWPTVMLLSRCPSGRLIPKNRDAQRS